jgi:5-oxoprolinase (ATP-hydrolysing)|tara:strand:+ start:618 stop:1142 length:525 start_codon:yes stop_codon:yes gene_type:complete
MKEKGFSRFIGRLFTRNIPNLKGWRSASLNLLLTGINLESASQKVTRWNGRSGVHSHMTNSRITDPQILELRYPVLLREFAYRLDLGGMRKHCGGNGLILGIKFLTPIKVAILSERRVYPPFGLEGGGNVKTGQNLWVKKSGVVEDLGGKNQKTAEPGDAIRILTPGGGGFGAY